MANQAGTVERMDGTAVRVFDLEMPRFQGMPIHDSHQPGYFYSLHRRHGDGYTPGQDTNAFVVRSDTASQFNLKKMSDLTAIASQLNWGLPPECTTNPLCGGALKDAYGIDIATLKVTPLAACDAPMAEALNSKAIDIAELCSTQPAITQFGFVVLEDDKVTQPAENIAPIVRNDFLAKVDMAAFSKLLDDVSAKVTTEVLLTLGVEVAVNNKDVDKVAQAWLKEQGFVK